MEKALMCLCMTLAPRLVIATAAALLIDAIYVNHIPWQRGW